MNVETTTVDFLTEHPALAGVLVSMQVPRQRPPRFVTVERTGGPEERYRGIPTLAVQVWAADRFLASELALVVQAALQEMVQRADIARVSVPNVYNFPDPDSGQARYQLTVELVTTD